jgi:uncharacterized protein YecT (DUF1311 family)
MKYFFFIFGLLVNTLSFSQTKDNPIEITPVILKQIKQEIELEALKFKVKLVKEKEKSIHIEFSLDTFRVEQLMSKWIELDYTDFALKESAYEGARLYDSLLNKYYKKLLGVLKGEDKKILLQAQKTWLAFRDSEIKLVETISKDEYSGGGTLQQLTEASTYLNIIKDRTIVLYDHYIRATQSE